MGPFYNISKYSLPYETLLYLARLGCAVAQDFYQIANHIKKLMYLENIPVGCVSPAFLVLPTPPLDADPPFPWMQIPWKQTPCMQTTPGGRPPDADPRSPPGTDRQV